jgi:scyllo-inositol 2-dehydrogenase (NADP+)
MDNIRNVAVVGLGKMGISHLAIARATPGLNVVAVCDSATMVGEMVERHCGLRFVPDFTALLQDTSLHGLIIATPTRLHARMAEAAIERGLHIFCEKPLTLSAADSVRLTEAVAAQGLVGQVGYHNRFVGTFAETKRLLAEGAIGRLRHIHAEAYGPVVLKPAARTWRSQPAEGGGCLYDYAAHPINLMNWYAGVPSGCAGSQLTRQWSADVDDAVYASLDFADGVTGQVSVNWSDETARKMTTRVTLTGDGGKIVADRQELTLFIGERGRTLPGYRAGWNIRYITELTPRPAFYLRGEEYSAQLEHFAAAMLRPGTPPINDFASAADTDHTLELIRGGATSTTLAPEPQRRTLLNRAFGVR